MTEVANFTVSEFLAVVNQTLEFAYNYVSVEGEIAECTISKNKWVYITIKDSYANVRCFTTVYALPGPIEPGMFIRLYGTPRVHEKYGFSFQAQQIQLVGRGSIRKGFELLEAKLKSEGLFDAERKRALPDVPKKVALITAANSAACADFLKITKSRWCGVEIDLYDTYVQGDLAPSSLIKAITEVQKESQLAEVIVIVRGGGSAEDLSAYNHEEVVRAISASRLPTLVAVGPEVDVCLSELVADVRASTPSNAAELLFPDKEYQLERLSMLRSDLDRLLGNFARDMRLLHTERRSTLDEQLVRIFRSSRQKITALNELLMAYDPRLPLDRGYALVSDSSGRHLSSIFGVEPGDGLIVQMKNGNIITEVKDVNGKKRG